MRMYSPSPTVGASPVPLYMRGAYLPHEGLGELGDDIVAPDLGTPAWMPTTMDTGIVPFVDPTLQPLIDSGLSADAAGLVADAASSGAISNSQFQQILNSRMSSNDIENLILGAGKFLPAGGAPRSIRPPTSSTAGTIIRSATDIAKAAAASNQPNLGPGASPRVNTSTPGKSPLTGSTSIAGMVIPNVALLGVGAVLLLAATRGR
jgi:hypothetical protein